MHVDIVFHVVGILIVWDMLVTWFNSGFPAVASRVLWKTGFRRNDPNFWPPDIADPMEWTKTRWEIWVNLRFPVLGELLTCPVCLSRHLTYLVLLPLWIITGVPAINLVGILFWPAVATRLLKL